MLKFNQSISRNREIAVDLTPLELNKKMGEPRRYSLAISTSDYGNHKVISLMDELLSTRMNPNGGHQKLQSLEELQPL